MKSERFQNLFPILLIVVALIGFVLHRTGLLDPVEGLFLQITAPIEEGMTSVGSRVGELTQTLRDLRDLRQRNEELEAENAALLLEIVRLREVEHEAVLKGELLNFARENPSFQIQGAHVVGRVIGVDPNNLQRSITLDAGTEVGIARNMPVVTERGLVGRISQAGNGWSKVLLIIDGSSSVNAICQSTRAAGLIRGLPDGSLLMEAIPQSDTVSVGDTVLTSGLGGNFPRQIPIGQITSVQRKDNELYQTATVHPTVDFGHLEAVLVITTFKPVEETEDQP
jgi:rod shape-determining protein MreC